MKSIEIFKIYLEDFPNMLKGSLGASKSQIAFPWMFVVFSRRFPVWSNLSFSISTGSISWGRPGSSWWLWWWSSYLLDTPVSTFGIARRSSSLYFRSIILTRSLIRSSWAPIPSPSFVTTMFSAASASSCSEVNSVTELTENLENNFPRVIFVLLDCENLLWLLLLELEELANSL